ncbi:MAG TPA: hypothetical protein VE218_03395 [Acidobacteriaceae bacterium]|nr:hypothetical protein [Acidobacteriaceae bacterium]
MKRRGSTHSRKITLAGVVLLLLMPPRPLLAQPTPAANSAFRAYAQVVESRLARQHQSGNTFLALAAPDPVSEAKRLRNGELEIEQLTPSAGAELSGSLLHHWRGTAFVPGAKAGDFERLTQDFKSYPQHFSPQVLQARLIGQNGDRMQAWMRVRQQHLVPVVLDTTYDITYGRLDEQHGYSISRSTRIAEIYAAGTAGERALNADEEHGFLWRLNTYWSYEEKDGGLYLQIEAVSLTRSIPHALGWVIRPYVESIPRDSLKFTLRSVCNALRKQPKQLSPSIERTERCISKQLQHTTQ